MNAKESREFINERHRLGRAGVDALRLQGSWDGIERLVTDELYPDQSHFIYELLQNAEDAGATRIHFELEATSLHVTHNGIRLFSEKDVTGITSIGQSQKREEVNKIGKFGVGFKSVFAYTDAPIVQSGLFSFSITDLIVPLWEDSLKQNDTRLTSFILRFDRKAKSSSQCFEEIASGLDSLPASTILFLRSLKEITWSIDDRPKGFIRTKNLSDLIPIRGDNYYVLRISNQTSEGKAETTSWLRFDAPLKEREDLCCSIAFLLTTKAGKDKDTDQDELPGTESKTGSILIQPLPEPGLLHIYFPAGKEPTGLFFHIHAPFAATVDRASIPFEHKGNRSLMDQLAKLSRSALGTIKDLDLLKPAFLGVLPNGRDELNDFYCPIRDEITTAFKKDEMLPTHYGGFAKSTNVIYGPRELRAFFSDDDLKRLLDNPRAVWCPGFRASSRPDFFLDTLDINALDWSEFVESWDKVMGGENPSPGVRKRADEWLRTMMARSGNDLDWIKSLYRLLSKADKETRVNIWTATDKRLKRSPVVWTEMSLFARGEGVYFSRGSHTIPGVSIEVVHPDLLKFDSKGNQDKEKEIKASLTMFGVVDYDEQAAISAFVKKIGAQKSIPIKDHLEQMACLLTWYQEDRIEDLSELEKAALFLDRECKFFRQPSKFFLDAPIRETGLSVFYEDDDESHALWPEYAKKFDAKVFADFAEEVGVRVELPFKKGEVTWNHAEAQRLLGGWPGSRRTGTETDVDWSIDGLEQILSRQNIAANKELWNRLCKVSSHYLYSRYAPNASHTARSGFSTLVHHLRTEKWVQAKSGGLEAPGDLDSSLIADGWSLDCSNGWLQVCGFGSHAQKEADAQRERKETAARLGVDPQIVEVLREMPAEKQQEWLRRIQDWANEGEFPEDEDVDVARRIERSEARANEAEDVFREERTRRHRISGNREKVRIYLTQRYSRDGVLYCQMSHRPMPFNLPDGQAYFEAVEIFTLPKEIEANYLCLSPICAAEFRHALQTREEDLRDQILELELDSDELEVVVEVPLNEHSVIRFAKRHLIDLHAALNAIGDGDAIDSTEGFGSAEEIAITTRALLEKYTVHKVKEILRRRGITNANHYIKLARDKQ
jgi:hypothetical protein